MIRNILLSAFASLKRKKMASLFTILTISLGMTMIILMLALLRMETGNVGPYANRSKSLFLSELVYIKNGKPVISKWENKYASSDFVIKHLKSLQTAADVCLYCENGKINIGSKLKPRKVQLMITDDRFWKIYDFKLLEGRFYNALEIKNKDNVCVITTSVANYLFNGNALDKYILGRRVIGVIKDEHYLFEVSAQVYFPYIQFNQVITSDNEGEEYPNSGRFQCTILAHRKSDFKLIQAEFRKKLELINATDFENKSDGLNAELLKGTEYNLQLAGLDKEPVILLIFPLLFGLILLVPILTLLNINSSSLNERLEEIGVKKTFGALRKHIIFQFLAEFILITLVSSIIGLALTVKIFSWVTETLVPGAGAAGFKIDLWLVLYIAAGAIVFALISGVWPVVRISRLKPINIIYPSTTGFNGRLKSRKWAQLVTYILLFLVFSFSALVFTELFKETQLSPGYNNERVVGSRFFYDPNLKVQADSDDSNKQKVKNELLKYPYIKSVAFTNKLIPGRYFPDFPDWIISDSIHKIAEAMVDADFFKVMEIVPVRGHLYDNNTTADGFVPAVITQFTEKNLFGNESGIGKIIIKKETGTRLKVVGVTDKYFHNSRASVFGQQNMIFTPITNGMADCMLVKFEEGTALPDLEKAIDKAVAANTKNSTGFESLLIDRRIDESINATRAFSLVFGLIVLNVIIGYWVVNWYHIRRRKHEMGVRMSMGATKQRVKQKVIMEGIWICLAACLIGSVIVFNIMIAARESYSDSAWIILGASFQSILMSLFITFWAAQQAAKVQPVEALAEE